jgi:L-phenylalanine/L-methionine N-acetyltransferase
LNEGIMPASVSPTMAGIPKASIDIARVEIRPAEPTDVEGVNNIFRTESASMGTLQSPYTAANTRTVYLTNPPAGRYPLVAVYEGKIIGSAGIGPVREGKCYQHVGYLGLGVHEAYQGAGVGRKLMQALIDIGDRWANYPRLDLMVFSDNPRAIALYESLGFKHEGILKQNAFRGGGYADSLAMGRVRL